MSQDMMQALSGSSLMSLSVGTLPAVKSGMMLDANPFASQLAQMTGPDAAMGDTGAAGVAAAGAGDAGFALALAQVPAPVAVAQAVPLADAPEIPALPEDASPTAIIEAVLGGVMKPAAAPVAASAPIAAEAPVTQAAAAVLAPQTPRCVRSLRRRCPKRSQPKTSPQTRTPRARAAPPGWMSRLPAQPMRCRLLLLPSRLLFPSLCGRKPLLPTPATCRPRSAPGLRR